MIVLHFLKRVLESLFLHKYSGPIDLLSALSVSIFYSFVAGTVSHLNASRFAAWDVTFALGLTLFLIGETVNYAHHAILAKLRGNTKDYFIPRGGLFELVVCPHYLFEIIAWAGIVLASRHLFTFIAVIGMTLYLSARSIKTLKWYREKFNDFPENRKSLIPFVF
jgi:very-long-chain enoyl-CoA reductase